VTLDGVAPPDMIISLDIWPSREAALDALFERCRATPACRQAMPDPAATLDAIARTLGERPRVVEIVDPSTGAARRVPASVDMVIGLLQPLLYAPETVALIPALLARARDGDLAPLVASATAFTGDLARQMNTALHYSVTCAEDVPRVGLAARARARGQALGAPGAHDARDLRRLAARPRAGRRVRAGAQRRSGADPVRRARSGDAAANGDAVASTLPTTSTSSRPATATSCRARVRAAAHRRVRRRRRLRDAARDCVKQLEASKPPALWTGLLGPRCRDRRRAPGEALRQARRVRAVDDVSFVAPRGEITGLLGPTAPARRRCCACSPR
jgi:hypothetical protein